MLLVTTVHGSRGCFEACPYFVAQFFGYRSCVAEFLMQFLQLMESGNHIRFVCQFLGGFAKMILYFKILLEVIFTEFVIQFQKVVELLDIQLVVLPQFVNLGLRHDFNFVPLLLQFLEFRIVLIGIFRRFHQLFQFLDDRKLDLQVEFFQFLLFCIERASFFLDDGHGIFEFLFQSVGLWNKLFNSSPILNELLLCGFLL